MGIIKKYNSWIFSLSKNHYVILIIFVSILEAVALAIVPSVIDGNYKNVATKFIVIMAVLLVINIPAHLYGYKQYNK